MSNEPDDGLDARLAALRAAQDDPAARLMEASVIARLTGAASPPVRVGRFVLTGAIGRGAMGVVYAARDERLAREVAIKVFPARGTGAELLAEARALALLSHPNVVAIHDADRDGDRVYLVMELVRGRTLREHVRATSPDWRTVVALVTAAGRGLAAAHRAGLVHRDVKPDNILIGDDGRARLADFGLAAHAGADHTAAGTPAYMAPELRRGAPASARADQYALCVTLAEALGRPPPAAPGSSTADDRDPAPPDRPERARRGSAPPPDRPERARRGSAPPPALAQLLARGTAADPADRFESVDALLDAIDRAIARALARRRRRLAAAAMIAVVAAAGATAAAWPARTESAAEACARTADRAAGVWNPARATVVRVAFLSTGRPFAADAADRVDALLGDFVHRYAAEVDGACRATFERGAESLRVLDRRRACLDRRLDRAARLVELLATADAPLVQRAVTAAHAAADLDDCRDGASLARPDDEPVDPRVRHRIAELRADLGRAEALELAGRYRDALAAARTAAAAAAAIDHAPLRAEAHYRVGVAERYAATLPEADATLVRAAAAAEAGGDDRLAASAWIRLVSVARARGDLREAATRLELARAKVRRVGDPPALLGFFLGNRAAVASARSDHAAARADYEAALALYTPLGLERPRVISVLSGLARTYAELGERRLGLATAERAAALAEHVHGPNHPDTAEAIAELGAARGLAGDHRAETGAHRRALAIRLRAFGDSAREVASSRNDLAGALTAVGDLAGAEAELTAALAIAIRRDGPDHPSVASYEQNLGWLLSGTRPADALPHLERALALRRASLGDANPAVALIRHHLGRALASAGRYAEARDHVERARIDLTAAFGASHPKVALAWGSLGMIELAAGRPAAAIAPLERAAALHDRGAGTPDDGALTHFRLARALWDAGADRARARRLARAARDALAPLATDPAVRAEIAAWLATH